MKKIWIFLMLWYYRHIKFRKLYNEEARLLNLMQQLLPQVYWAVKKHKNKKYERFWISQKMG